MRIFNSIEELVGNTPLVRLNKLVGKDDAEVLLKLEYYNPGGSLKDRIAFGMVEDAERNGRLKSGMTIIESSSGNTAIGLSIIGAIRGYKVVCICDRFVPFTKKLKLHSYGAHVVFLPQTPEGMDTVELRIEIAKKMAEKIPNSMTLLQYDNLANRETHYRATGQEIWRDTEGTLDACIVAVGTCGTISGVGKALKEKNRNIKIIGVEPRGSIIFGGTDAPYLVQGGGLSFIPKNLMRHVIDEGVKVSDQEAFETARLLAKEEGIMVGGSAGSVVFVALRLAKKLGKGKRIVAIVPDSGDRYLDTFYSDEWLDKHGISRAPFLRAPPDDILTSVVKSLNCTIDSF